MDPSSKLFQRPSPKDTDEDLIQLQREFEAIAAPRKQPRRHDYLSKLIGDEDLHSETPPESKTIIDSEKVGSIKNEDDASQGNILLKIVERPDDYSKLKDFSSRPPRKLPAYSEGCRKQSLFMRTLNEKKKEKTRTIENFTRETTSKTTNIGKSERESIENPLCSEISDTVLGNMTEEEILEERNKLLKSLDPTLVEFLKKGKHKSNIKRPDCSQTASNAVVDDEAEEACAKFDHKELPIKVEDLQKYPGMQTLEADKLAWAGTVQTSGKSDYASDVGKNARFGFDGELLLHGYDTDKTFNTGLHHHGEEMERAGYTLNELITLARSHNSMQSAFGLDTLSNIFERAHSGTFDKIFDKSLFETVVNIDFIFVIRSAMDVNDPVVINSALKCLASILYPSIEEACLDETFLWEGSEPKPLLEVGEGLWALDKSIKPSELKDFEVLAEDFLKFLIERSDMLCRVSYLMLKTPQVLNEKGVISILKILIRASRYKPQLIASKYSEVIEYIITNYLSQPWTNFFTQPKDLRGIPLGKALKLLRVLSDSCEKTATKVYTKYKVFPSLLSYLAFSNWNSQPIIKEAEVLIFESFKLWITLLRRRNAIDEYSNFFPVLMGFLMYYERSDSLNEFDLVHAAHLFCLLKEVLTFGLCKNSPISDNTENHSHVQLVKACVGFIKTCVDKILGGLLSLEEKSHKDQMYVAAAKGIEFLNATYCLGTSEKKLPLTKQIRSEDKLGLRETLLKAQKTLTHSRVTGKLRSCSLLLNDSLKNAKKRYPSNMCSVDAVMYGSINPIISKNSPFGLLTTIYGISHDFDAERTETEVPQLDCLNSEVSKYLDAVLSLISGPTERCFVDNYFVKFELMMLSRILESRKLECNLSFAYFLVPYCPTSSRSICKNLIKVVIRSFKSDCSVKLSDDFENFFFYHIFDGDESENPDHPLGDSTKKVQREAEKKVRFSQEVNEEEKQSTILFEPWKTPGATKNWSFAPLVNLHRDVKKRQKETAEINWESEIVPSVLKCLKFNKYILESSCQSIIHNVQNFVEFYISVCRVFMFGDPTLYYDASVNEVLQELLTLLLNSSVFKEFSGKSMFTVFKSTPEFYGSFNDFYSDLVTDFFETSYLHKTFTAYIMLPLRASEEEELRLTFWKHESIGILRLSEEQKDHELKTLIDETKTEEVLISLLDHLLHDRISSSAAFKMLAKTQSHS